MMKKLIIISYAYPPANLPSAQRPYFFAKYLSGWQKIVISPKVFDSALGISNWAKELSDTNIVRTKNIDMKVFRKAKDENFAKQPVKSENRSIFTRLSLKSRIMFFPKRFVVSDKAFLWRPSAYKEALKLIKEDDAISCIFSSSPLISNHLVASRLKRKTRLPWVADFRDFHYVNAIENQRGFLRTFINKLWEQRIMNEADRVVFISESMKQEYVQRYPGISDKARVIHNGFDPEEYSPREEPLPRRPITIFYAGSFYGGDRDPLPLFMALDKLVEQGVITDNEVEVRIAGNIDSQLLDRIKSLRSSSSLKLYGKIDRKKVLQLMQESHFLWLIMNTSKAHALTFPVKFFEYLASRRPILAFVPDNTEVANVIKDLCIGDVLQNDLSKDTCEKNANVLHKLFSKVNNQELLTPLHVDDNAVRKYSREYQGEQLSTVLEELISK